MLERGSQVGETWARLYDSLVLHTGRHLSALPGMPLPSTLPTFVPRRDFLDYLHRYADRFRLPIDTGVEVTSAAREDGQWRLERRSGPAIHAHHLVVATGIVSNPYVPAIAGRDRFGGRLIHSVEYRRPDARLDDGQAHPHRRSGQFGRRDFGRARASRRRGVARRA